MSQYKGIDQLFAFIRERYSIYRLREAGKPKPWTKDPILQQYRFCNVYREWDAVTRWIAKNWRAPHRGDRELWFAMVVARLINQPSSLQALGYPIPWRPSHFISKLVERQEAGLRVFNGAYIVSTNGWKMEKVPYLSAQVLNPLWTAREHISRVINNETAPRLEDVHKVLSSYNGLGSFMAAQVVADLKYVQPLSNAVDWWSFTASGPGSRRGLNRVMGKPINAPSTEVEWRANLGRLGDLVAGRVKRANMPRLHNQDLQNCLCEFDKYQRALLGQGRPKQLFQGV